MIVVKVADVPLAMGISAAVGGRAVIADELDNLTALSPYSLRWLPFFNPLILGLYFPFLRATVAAEADRRQRSEEHTSELQSLMRISYAVFCLKKKNTTQHHQNIEES